MIAKNIDIMFRNKETSVNISTHKGENKSMKEQAKTRGNGDGFPDYTVYFYCQFSKPLTDYGVWSVAIPEGPDICQVRQLLHRLSCQED